MHRSDDITESIGYENNATADITSLQSALDTWYENKPLKRYISTRFKDLVFEDPNAYIIVEFENDDPINKKPTPYPFEVRSAQVYDPYRVNGVLKYLITFHPVVYKTKNKGDVTGYKYTLYGSHFSFVCQHIPDGALFDFPEGWQVIKMKYGERKGQSTFIVKEYESKSPECPAYRVGYLDDPETDGRTKVSVFYSAKNILTDLIWNKSEYDLSKALHGFYQKFAFVNECKTCHGEGVITDHENDRELACTKCKGTGKDIHTTVQDVVFINMPADGQPWDLSKLIHFAQIPESLITKQREDVVTDQKDVFNCIFGANVLERSELAETATAKNYDWRAVNNTLFEYADNVSDFYKFAVKMSAAHRSEDAGLIVQHSHSQDFKLESILEKIEQRGAAMNAGAPMDVIGSFDLDILGKQHRDDPIFLKEYKAKEKFRPMSDKSRDERMVLISGLPQNDPERILYIYFNPIFRDIFDEYKNFADLAYKRQKEIVYNKVNEYMTSARPSLSLAMAGDEEE